MIAGYRFCIRCDLLKKDVPLHSLKLFLDELFVRFKSFITRLLQI